jgi:hypothetical protein
MSRRVRALPEHHFALRKAFPVQKRRAQDLVDQAETVGRVPRPGLA